MAADPVQKQPGRGPGKRFTKGASGNPNGRRAGSRNKVTMLAEQLLEADAVAVVAAVLSAAKDGDMTAARLVLDRIAPARRSRAIVLSLPKIATVTDVSAALAEIVATMARGEISPAKANEVGAVIELYRRGLEAEDHERRLSEIEGEK